MDRLEVDPADAERVAELTDIRRAGLEEHRLEAGGSPRSPVTPGSLARRELGRWLRRIKRGARERAFVGGLHRLEKVLRMTPLDQRYWVVGGLLLGWAREGRPLASDLHDADFAYLDEDHERFLASVPALANAGFMPRHRFAGGDGRYVEHRFRRDGIHFEFFRMTQVGDRWRYSMFEVGDEPVELVAELPAQPRVVFRFLGRRWRKVADHDLALRAIYGDWHLDRPEWAFTSDRAIIDRIPMTHPTFDWTWPDPTA
jgi:hypothetical protein